MNFDVYYFILTVVLFY